MKNSVAALGIALTFTLPPAARADDIQVPAVPAKLQVEAPNVPYLVGHAFGTQNYICLPSGASVAWILFTPQATLLNDDDQQVITHFFSPNPDEVGVVIRAAWQHSRDSSTVWARAKESSVDEAFVAKGAIPWVLLEMKGTEEGPTGGDRLTQTTFVQRLNTLGGAAPTTGCSSSADIGRSAFVPYKADYFFWKDPTR